jgi:cysteine desulfuration protein SufE
MASIDQTIEELADEFALLPDWEERISYVIELARELAPLAESERTEENRIRGCVSRVWLVSEKHADEPDERAGSEFACYRAVSPAGAPL